MIPCSNKHGTLNLKHYPPSPKKPSPAAPFCGFPDLEYPWTLGILKGCNGNSVSQYEGYREDFDSYLISSLHSLKFLEPKALT